MARPRIPILPRWKEPGWTGGRGWRWSTAAGPSPPAPGWPRGDGGGGPGPSPRRRFRAGAAALMAFAFAAGWLGWWQAGGVHRALAPGRIEAPAAPRQGWRFRDDAGHWVTLARPPRRVACAQREICQLSRALLGETGVVPWPGAGEPVTSPPQVDLVLLPEVTRVPGLAQVLRRSGVSAATLRLRHVGELPAAVERLGQWLGKPGPARRLASHYRVRIQRIRARTEPLRGGQRPPVLVWVWHQPPVWAGEGTPPAVLVQWAGGRLVVGPGIGPKPGDGGTPTKLSGLRPPGPISWLWPRSRWLDGGGWRTGSWGAQAPWPAGTRVLTPLLAAVGEAAGAEVPLPAPLARLPWYFMPPRELLAGGPDAVTGLERLAAWLHPELFSDLDVKPLPLLSAPAAVTLGGPSARSAPRPSTDLPGGHPLPLENHQPLAGAGPESAVAAHQVVADREGDAPFQGSLP